MPPEIPQEAIDAAEATSSRRALRGDEETARYKERLRVVLEAAYPAIEQAIRNEERVKVLGDLTTDETLAVAAQAFEEEVGLPDGFEWPCGSTDEALRPSFNAVAAALATLDQEGPCETCGGARELEEDIGGRGEHSVRCPDCLDQEDEAPVAEPDGAALIAAERRRQMEVEGWTPEHDDQHDYWELSRAAAGYLGAPGVEWSGVTGVRGGRTPLNWPFRPEDFKPTGDAVRDLVKAGALVAAEIDRVQRLNAPDSTDTVPSGGVEDALEEEKQYSVAALMQATRALRYIAGEDVAGMDAHLRPQDVASAALGEVDALIRSARDAFRRDSRLTKEQVLEKLVEAADREGLTAVRAVERALDAAFGGTDA